MKYPWIRDEIFTVTRVVQCLRKRKWMVLMMNWRLEKKKNVLSYLVEQDTLNNITNLYLRKTYVLLFFCQKSP